MNLVKPTLDYDLRFNEDVPLRAGASISVPISYTGIPKPTVNWKFKDDTLIPTNKVSIQSSTGQSTLHLKGVGVENQGKYTFTAENKAGTVTKDIKINVKGKSQIK